MKIYIAGKIGEPADGQSVENWQKAYTDKFNGARNEVAHLGHDPISPIDLPHEHARTWINYMREDLTALLSCDAVLALPDWSVSRGATIEVNTAEALGITVYYDILDIPVAR